MNTTAKIALAASGGYILGRTKKMKLAAMLALFLAGQKLPKSPMELIQQGAGALAKNEKFGELSQQVTGSLMDAGKAAAGRSAERWLTSVGDRLRDGLPTPEGDAADRSDEAEDTDEDAEQDSDQESGQESDQDAEADDVESDDAQAETDVEDQATDDDSDSDSESDSSAKSRTATKKAESATKKAGSGPKKSTSSRSSSTRSSNSSSRRSATKGA